MAFSYTNTTFSEVKRIAPNWSMQNCYRMNQKSRCESSSDDKSLKNEIHRQRKQKALTFTYSHTSNTTCCNKSGNFCTIVTGWPDVKLTPYIGAVVLYRVLQRRDGVALHLSDGFNERASKEIERWSGKKWKRSINIFQRKLTFWPMDKKAANKQANANSQKMCWCKCGWQWKRATGICIAVNGESCHCQFIPTASFNSRICILLAAL